MTIADQKAIKGRIAILVATIIWGSSFFIMKNTLDEIPVFYVQALRFSIAAIVLCFGIRKHFKKIDKKTLLYGIIAGVLIFCADSFQTYGLYYTTPAKSAFLTTTYCVIVPFIAWIITRKRPAWIQFAAVGICIVGIGLICLNEGLSIEFGDALTLCCGLFYALHIIIMDRAKEKNTIMICIIQCLVTALLCWGACGITGSFINPASISPESWLSVAYMGILGSGICFFLQAYGQKYTPPVQAALILILESVFGTLFSGIFYGEVFTTQMIIGFILVFIAVAASEAGPAFINKIKQKKGLTT